MKGKGIAQSVALGRSTGKRRGSARSAEPRRKTSPKETEDWRLGGKNGWSGLGVELNKPGFLTQDEAEIVLWMARGLTVEETQKEMGFGKGTINYHKASIAEKLQCQNKTGPMVIQALRNKILILSKESSERPSDRPQAAKGKDMGEAEPRSLSSPGGTTRSSTAKASSPGKRRRSSKKRRP